MSGEQLSEGAAVLLCRELPQEPRECFIGGSFSLEDAFFPPPWPVSLVHPFLQS